MTRLFHTVLLLLAVSAAASAQIRTSGDNADGNFVIGLDNYLRFSASGSGTAAFDFSTKGKAFKALVKGQSVRIAEGGANVPVYDDGALCIDPARPDLRIPGIGLDALGRPMDSNEIIVGVHDFTNDHEPELVIALRDVSGKGAHGDGIVVYVLEYAGGAWKSLGEMAAFGEEVEECRVFRQVVTLSDGKKMYTWTYRGSAFDFRSNTGSSDPASAFSAAR